MADVEDVKQQPKPWRTTPLIESRLLSKAAGCRILLKLENLQPGGSFKSRGIGNFMARRLAEQASASSSSSNDNDQRVHYYTSSGGNAGIACVTAAVTLGQQSTVVVPLSTSQLMITKIRDAGADDVIQQGATWREADDFVREHLMVDAEARGENAIYVPPFDHADVWAGHATMVDEIAEQLREMGVTSPSLVACSVGGGGLLAGVLQGVDAQPDWDRTVVLAVETHGADSLGQALEQERLVTLPGITSLATTLGAKRVCSRAFELAMKGKESGRVRNVVLSDAEAAMGVWQLAELERIMVELSCGVTIALCFGGRLQKSLGRPVRADETVVLVVCGGHYVTTELIETWRRTFKDDVHVKDVAEYSQ